MYSARQTKGWRTFLIFRVQRAKASSHEKKVRVSPKAGARF